MSDLTEDTSRQKIEDLFREHYSLVYRTAFRITGRAEDTEDVVQSVFLRLMRRGIPPDFFKNPKGYLYRAAVNLALTAVESRQRYVFGDDSVTREIPDTSANNGLNSELDVHREWFSRALLQLRPRAVEILLLRYEKDYSDAEIARMLGTSRGVIAISLFRSRARLKTILREFREKQL